MKTIEQLVGVRMYITDVRTQSTEWGRLIVDGEWWGWGWMEAEGGGRVRCGLAVAIASGIGGRAVAEMDFVLGFGNADDKEG